MMNWPGPKLNKTGYSQFLGQHKVVCFATTLFYLQQGGVVGVKGVLIKK
jgi:hypothetical protein